MHLRIKFHFIVLPSFWSDSSNIADGCECECGNFTITTTTSTIMARRQALDSVNNVRQRGFDGDDADNDTTKTMISKFQLCPWTRQTPTTNIKTGKHNNNNRTKCTWTQFECGRQRYSSSSNNRNNNTWECHEKLTTKIMKMHIKQVKKYKSGRNRTLYTRRTYYLSLFHLSDKQGVFPPISNILDNILS